MKPLKESDMDVYIGRKVRVVYVQENYSGGNIINIDKMITPAGVLKAYNKDTKEVSIEFEDGSQRVIKVYEVFVVSC